MRTRKVGSLTCGVMLIVFGMLFFAHVFIPMLNYNIILKMWPIVLIMLGSEMLYFNYKNNDARLVYDFGAIVLTIILAIFALLMGFIQYCLEIGNIWF